MADITNGEKTRKARRDWIDAQGNPVDAGEESKAVGFRYTHIPTALRADSTFDPETDAAPQESIFELANIPEPTKTMLAIFGGLTLAGNIVSTATNPKSKGDPDANPIPDLVSRFEEMANGVWSGERGAGGPRYNPEALAQAIAKVKGEADQPPGAAQAARRPSSLPQLHQGSDFGYTKSATVHSSRPKNALDNALAAP